jgi:hypothetical protein
MRLLLLFIILISCTKENKDVDASTYYDVPNLSKKHTNRLIKEIVMDTLELDSNIETSYAGHFWIHRDTLYFSDTYFGYVFKFDRNGNALEKYLGKGKGPNEVLGLHNSVPLQHGFAFFYGGNNSLYTFNKDWKKTGEGRIDWGIKRSYKEVLKNPEPSLPESYEFDSGYENILKPWDENYLAIAITASHPKFWGYSNSDLYYNHSRILALINVETGKIDKFIGRRSPFYLSHINLPNFDHFNYEVGKTEVFVNFWPDKYIYIIDKETGLAIGKYGVEGKNMKTDYEVTNSYKEASEKHYVHRKKYGYYSHLKYISEKDILFRSYKKGELRTTDGIQIYKDHYLIGDLEVPKGFEILGVINDMLIGTIVSHDHEKFKLFKITLIYEN